jgi:hypothetical protein
VLLASTTIVGAIYYQPQKDAPYIPKNLAFYPVSGGITSIDLTTNRTITPTVPNDHIDVYTTARYQNYEYKAGNNITIPLYLKFISDTKNTTTIVIDPQNPMTLTCTVSLGLGKGSIKLNDYFHYTPSGVIKLQRDELVKVTLTMDMPEGLWPYNHPRVVPFNLLGVDSDVIMVLRFKWEIDV